MLKDSATEVLERTKSIHSKVILTPLLLIGLIYASSSYAQQTSQDLQIISPVDGTVVAPGETISVVVSVAQGTSFESVGIVVEDIGFGPYEAKDNPPYVFSLHILKDLIGRKQITAFGITGPGAGVDSQPVTIDIETPAAITSLGVRPEKIFFERAGEQRSLSAGGTFDDGTTLTITQSTRTTYSSNNPSVATVDSTGLVAAVGPGAIGMPEITTEIILRYADKSVVVPVIFRPVDNVGIDIKPGSYPNSINLGSGGTVPVAILSTADFDATTVDPLSVTLASAPVKLKGKGKPMASKEDVNGDGRLDLVVHVETEALQLSPTSKKAILDGKTFSGMPIRGSDFIVIVP